MKTCSKCKVEKPKAEFSKDATRNGGLQYKCRSCEREYRQANAEKIAERKREYSKANAERIKEQKREYRKANHEKIAESWREYYKENTEKIASKAREYRKANAETIAARNREYYKANAEKLAEYNREYRKANHEKIAESWREYYRSNIEKFVAWHAAWVAANPDKKAAIGRNRRARKRNADGRHSAADVRAIFEAQRGLCANCNSKLFKSGKHKFHADHIMPLALGGSNWPENLQCLCPTCNLSKGAKHPDDWAAANGRLL